MQKGKIKIIALIGAFLLTILIVGLVNRHSNKDTTGNMAQASLPVVSLFFGDQQMNELYGHTSQMDAVYMRDSITPLKKDRILPVSVQTYGDKVDEISYEIRSMDTKRLVAEAEVQDFEMKEDEITADIKIQNIVEEGNEYLFILKLKQNTKEIYYYTRLALPVDSYIEESLDFVMNFHDTAMNKEAAGTLATYLEPDASGSGTGLQKVTIHSPLRQVTWADFKFRKITEPIPSMKEINNVCNVITLRYLISSEGEHGENEYYNVEEYYRVRYTSARTYLLDYERTMNRIFTGSTDSVYEKYIQLGIRSKTIHYEANENGNIVVFVQEGDLWGYNRNTNQMIKIFSFRSDGEEMDRRENYDQHDIRIVSIDESGSVDFLIYGYMNRGLHEGKTGISACHYDAVTNTVEEELFVPVTTSYQVMKEDLGELAYQNNQKQFFLIASGILYQIDSENLTATEKMGNLQSGDYAVSRNGRYIAYKNEKQEGSLKLEDLETGKTHEITAETGEKIQALGFIGEDFIYGAARESDLANDITGKQILPMYQVKIVSTGDEYKVAKTYEKSGYYISEVRIDGNTIYLTRLQNAGGTYQEAGEDTIVNSEKEEAVQMDIQTTSQERKQTQVQIEMAKAPETSRMKRIVSKEIIHEKPREIELKIASQRQYYAYAAGKVILGSKDPGEAIRAADSKMGVVVGEKQQYIWRRTKQASRESLIAAGMKEEGESSVEKCLNLILKKEGLNLNTGPLLSGGESTKQVLEEALKECEVLDLTGCTVEQVLYYVSNGTPVLAMRSADEAVLITGYDASNAFIYDTTTGSVSRQGLEDANTVFEEAGNVFYVYLK
ncbi:MAG: hypothetical protein HFI37_06030 [Lachnospiraceae bacterium]|nr:hypothetical protein [Lachnospiraceae bacterium]